jgi:hypothetical protein
MYADPPVEAELAYRGDRLSHAGSIPTSYGMDFVEIDLNPTLLGQAITVKVQGEGGTARFNVEVWRLGPGEEKPRALTAAPENAAQSGNSTHEYTISGQDTTDCDRLTLIITRLDPHETADPEGNYQVTVDTADHTQ